jgi:hypothetical protein
MENTEKLSALNALYHDIAAQVITNEAIVGEHYGTWQELQDVVREKRGNVFGSNVVLDSEISGQLRQPNRRIKLNQKELLETFHREMGSIEDANDELDEANERAAECEVQVSNSGDAKVAMRGYCEILKYILAGAVNDDDVRRGIANNAARIVEARRSPCELRVNGRTFHVENIFDLLQNIFTQEELREILLEGLTREEIYDYEERRTIYGAIAIAAAISAITALSCGLTCFQKSFAMMMLGSSLIAGSLIISVLAVLGTYCTIRNKAQIAAGRKLDEYCSWRYQTQKQDEQTQDNQKKQTQGQEEQWDFDCSDGVLVGDGLPDSGQAL